MKEMIMNLGNRMVVLARVCNIDKREWATKEERFTQTRPSNKFDYEFEGMVMALKAMDIDYDFEWDNDVVCMTSITIMGIKFDI